VGRSYVPTPVGTLVRYLPARCSRPPGTLTFMMTITTTLSAAALQRLDQAFKSAGKSLYLVGGSVRDALLGRPNTDYDFTTDAHPEEIRRLLSSVRPENVFAVGEKFGTICATIEGHEVQVTAYRGEVYNPRSRKPEVTFGVSLRQDLARRDFTINAMAQDIASGELVDPFGGRDDLANGLVRAVGDPAERFAEDPLRLLRAVRFVTTLTFTIQGATRDAVRAQAAELANISRERVAEEMNKILLSEQPSRGLRLLVELDLLRQIIPEALPMAEIKTRADRRHKDIWGHVLQVVDRAPPTLELRWAALLHDIAKPATYSYRDGEVHFFGHEALGAQWARDIMTRLHYDRATVERVSNLVGMHMRINTYGDWTDGAVRRFMREAGDQLPALFDLSRADITSHRFERVQAVLATVDSLEQRCRELEAQAEIAKMRPPLDGNELMAIFGRPPGPWLGRLKAYLLDLVLDGELDQDDKATGEERARAFLAEHPEI